jgi:chorismate-pyruvate lyase
MQHDRGPAMRWIGRLAGSGAALAAAVCVATAAAAAPDFYAARLEALALLQTLNADLLSHDSATAVLQDWCDAHGPGGLKIIAQRVRGPDKPLPDEARAALGDGAAAGVRYRHVLLACGPQVLSEADNWYLPARLTADMNRQLEDSETPFGVVVRPLDFRRRNLSARLLYVPLAPGWEGAPVPRGAPPPIPAQVLRHTAVLTTPEGAPFSYVVESYTAQTLTMALPKTVPLGLWR